MSKLGAIVFGSTIAVAYAYYILGAYFSPLLNWLGPLLGAPFRFAMGLFLLSLGSPFAYVAVGVGWVIAGISCGLFARSTIGALGTAIIVKLILVVVLVLSILGILASVVPVPQSVGFGLGESPPGTGPGPTTGPLPVSPLGLSGLSSFPPFPPGTSIASLLSEPLFNEIPSLISRIGTTFPANVTQSPAAVENAVLSFLTPFIIQSLEALALLLVPAGVTGYLMRRLTKRLKLRGASRPNKSGIAPNTPALALILLVILSLALVAPLISANGQSASRSATTHLSDKVVEQATGLPAQQSLTMNYSESAAAVVTPDGSVANVFAFFTNSALGTNGEQPALNELQKTSYTIIISQSGLSQYLPAGIVPLSVQQYLTYIPSGLILIGYNFSCAGVPAQTYGVLAAVSSLTGMKGFTTFTIPGAASLFSSNTTQSTPQSCLVLALTSTTLADAAKSISSNLLPTIHQTGLIGILSSGLSTGYLVPEETMGSVNMDLFVAGFANTRYVSSLASGLLSSAHLNSSGLATSSTGLSAFVIDISLIEGVFHSPSGKIGVTPSELFGYGSPVSFANGASLSLLVFGYPNGPNASLGFGTSGSSLGGTEISNGTALPRDYSFLVYLGGALSSAEQGALNSTGFSSLNSTSSGYGDKLDIIPLSPSKPLSADLTLASFKYEFPPAVKFTKTITAIQPGKLQVTLSLTNLGNQGLTNVVLNDTQFISDYHTGISLQSGIASSYQSYLAPGQSDKLTYTVSTSGFGTFASPPAIAIYSANGTTYTIGSNPAYYHLGPPDVFSSFFEMLGSGGTWLFGIIHAVTKASVPMGGEIFEYIAGIFLILAVFMEYRSYRTWRKTSLTDSSTKGEQKNGQPAPQTPLSTDDRSGSQIPPPPISAAPQVTCPHCGASLPQRSIYCMKCGNKI